MSNEFTATKRSPEMNIKQIQAMYQAAYIEALEARRPMGCIIRPWQAFYSL
jgi:hypothetical protein